LINNLLLTGGPTHDFANTSQELAGILGDAQLAVTPTVTTIVEHPDEFFTLLRAAMSGDGEPWDLVTIYALRWRMESDRYESQRANWAYDADPEDLSLLDHYVRSGGGLLALHTAVICFDAQPPWQSLIGASWSWQRSSHPAVGAVQIDCTDDASTHAVTASVESFEIIDEVYGFLDEVDDLRPLLVSNHGGRSHPLVWTRSSGSGRVVVDLLGHGMESLSHPIHREVLRRAAAWAVGEI
jgi:hypothetical protein